MAANDPPDRRLPHPPTVYDRTLDETGAVPLPPEAAPVIERATGRRSGHTVVQRALLAVSVLTIVACFVAAIGLVATKLILDRRQVLDISSATRGTIGTLPAVADTDPPSVGSESPDSTSVTTPSSASGSTTEATASTNAPVAATAPASPTTESTKAPAAATTPASPLGPTGETFPPSPDAMNFLVAASDANACVDPNSPWANAADPNRPANSRSDSIMVIRIDPTTNRVAVLSFPRDLWVRIPGRGSQRINAAYRENNPDRLIQTIEQNFKVPIDRYLQVDFCAFKRIVEAVGGVDVAFARPIRDDRVGLMIAEPGCHHFVGDEALAYVRSRHLKELRDDGKWKEDPAADFGRIARQQDFLTRVLARALDKGLFDPSVARGLLETLINGEIVPSAGMNINEFLSFAGVLRNVDPANVRRYTIQSKGAVIGGNSVLDWKPFVNNTEMRSILRIFRGEAQLPADPPPAVPVNGVGGDAAGTDDRADEPADNTQKAILPERDVVCPG